MEQRMTNAELAEFNKHRNLTQICLCTNRKIEEVLQEWVDKLKVGPWGIVEMSNETVKDFGWGDQPITEPFKYYCAVAMFGQVQIEIVQKVYGPFMGDRFLKEKGEGLQHFKETFSAEEFPEAVRRYEQVFRKTFFGTFGDNRFCNFDSEDSVGFTFEVGNDLDANLDPSQIRVFPPED